MVESLGRDVERLKLTEDEKGSQVEIGDNVISHCDSHMLNSLLARS